MPFPAPVADSVTCDAEGTRGSRGRASRVHARRGKQTNPNCGARHGRASRVRPASPRGGLRRAHAGRVLPAPGARCQLRSKREKQRKIGAPIWAGALPRRPASTPAGATAVFIVLALASFPTAAAAAAAAAAAPPIVAASLFPARGRATTALSAAHRTVSFSLECGVLPVPRTIISGKPDGRKAAEKKHRELFVESL